jgi:hypothetical protein
LLRSLLIREGLAEAILRIKGTMRLGFIPNIFAYIELFMFYAGAKKINQVFFCSLGALTPVVFHSSVFYTQAVKFTR